MINSHVAQSDVLEGNYVSLSGKKEAGMNVPDEQSDFGEGNSTPVSLYQKSMIGVRK